MANALDQILGLHAEIEQGLDVQLASIAAREAEAHRLIAQCFEDRQRIDRKRAGLKDAERIYRDAFEFSSNSPQAERRSSTPRFSPAKPVLLDDSASSLLGDAQSLYQKQVRARIGPQRFLMLDALSTMTQLCLEDMATLTRLPYRRVKDQMVSDVRSGMVGMSGDYYTLTSAGMDLLSRFKVYKRMHGQPLPTVDDLHSEDDRDDAETDNHLAEREDWPAKEDKQTGTDHTLADYSIADDDGRIRNSGF